jgi:hypothetical protein
VDTPLPSFMAEDSISPYTGKILLPDTSGVKFPGSTFSESIYPSQKDLSSLEVRSSYNPKAYLALANCQIASNLQGHGHAVLCMPETLYLMSTGRTDITSNFHSTLSIVVTGRTKEVIGNVQKGSDVMVFAHLPNHYSDPRNIRYSFKNLRKGAGEYPLEKFYGLIKKAEDGDRRLGIIDYGTALKKATTRLVSLDDARENPLTSLIIGGEEETAHYFDWRRQNIGDKIRIFYPEDMDTVPRARLLYVFERKRNCDIVADCSLTYNGNFLWIPMDMEASRKKGFAIEALFGR